MARSNVCKWLLLILTACVVSSGLQAVGQSTFGAIVGTVKDQSGSVVPGATRDPGEQGQLRQAHDDEQCFGEL